jgi:hypothetical protein|tara:strand:- start:867 stop:1064 length:198 start_codon:yes stop_codon:yes gene_type:complete
VPRATVSEIANQIDTHEKVCGERWKNAYARFDRIEEMIKTNNMRLWWIAGIIISLLVSLVIRSMF